MRELLEKRANLVSKAREIASKYQPTDVMSAEDKTQYDAIMADVGVASADIEERNATADRLAQLETATQWEQKVSHRNISPNGNTETRKANNDKQNYDRYLRGQMSEMEYRISATHVTADTAGAGSELAPPYEFVNQIIVAKDKLCVIRPHATVQKLTNSAQGWVPVISANPDDADWTVELGPVTTDTAMTTSKRELKPSLLSKEIDISKKELQILPSVAEVVMSRMGYKFGVAEENGFMTGNGTNQPLGLFTASANGINTDRDVAISAVGSLVPTMDYIMALKYKVNPVYWNNAKFVAHQNFWLLVATIKDSLGRYLWQPSLQVGQPDIFAGCPALSANFAPSTYTASSYGVLFGDLSYYWIAELGQYTVQRCVELGARTNVIPFIATEYCDGMPVLSEAFARGKFAAAST